MAGRDVVSSIERVVRRLASTGAPMPTNPEMQVLCGVSSRATIAQALNRLHERGVIILEREYRQRRICVVETGDWTSWGEYRPGHAPGPRKPKSEEKPKEIRELYPALPPPVPVLIKPKPPVFPAPTCQWPSWGDDEAPTHLYCGKPSVKGRSWCAAHMACVYGSTRSLEDVISDLESHNDVINPVQTEVQMTDVEDGELPLRNWNYRVMVHTKDCIDPYFAVHEVYYGEDGSVDGWTDVPARVGSSDEDGIAGIKGLLQRIASAADKPVLDYLTGKEIGPTYEMTLTNPAGSGSVMTVKRISSETREMMFRPVTILPGEGVTLTMWNGIGIEVSREPAQVTA